MDFKIIKKTDEQTELGAAYIFVNGQQIVAAHFSSNDAFGRSDLLKHKEVKELIGDMSIVDYYKIPIIPSQGGG